jgi:hypothetical protein
MGMRSRQKGKRGEREVVALFKGVYPDAKRGWWQSRGGSVVPDVDGTPFWIEVKLGARPNPLAALQQAIDNEDDDYCVRLVNVLNEQLVGDVPHRTPLACCRKTPRGEWTATMRLSDLLEIAKLADAMRVLLRGDAQP